VCRCPLCHTITATDSVTEIDAAYKIDLRGLATEIVTIFSDVTSKRAENLGNK
jgi:hypothetical protein